MEWSTLHFSRSEVDACGRLLASGHGTPAEIDHALEVINDWRAAHSFALNTFQVGLRSKARNVYEHALVAQRLKRVSSIVAKLRRFEKMNLSRMQDIGGCRAVLESVRQVRRVAAAYDKSRQQHELISSKDYIAEPKASGYRGCISCTVTAATGVPNIPEGLSRFSCGHEFSTLGLRRWRLWEPSSTNL